MRGLRVVRAILPLVLVLVVVALLVLVFTARPDLESAQRDVDKTWTPLQPALTQRYTLLRATNEAVRDVPGPVHELVGEVDVALARWQDVGETNANVAARVAAADRLEALGRRLVLASRASARVQANPTAKAAVDAFAATGSPAAAAAFNRAVLSYQQERSGPARRVIADVLGYDEIVALDTTSTTA
jgi:hypothetical protein